MKAHLAGDSRPCGCVLVTDGGSCSLSFVLGLFELSVNRYGAGCREKNQSPAIEFRALRPEVSAFVGAARARFVASEFCLRTRRI